MRLTEQSRENLRICDRVGFDTTESGVLVYVERDGNRAYLHTADGPACFKSVADASTAVRKHRPRRLAGPGQ